MTNQINHRYIVRVKDLMTTLLLPSPRKRNIIINYGERLPIITEGYYKC